MLLQARSVLCGSLFDPWLGGGGGGSPKGTPLFSRGRDRDLTRVLRLVAVGGSAAHFGEGVLEHSAGADHLGCDCVGVFDEAPEHGVDLVRHHSEGPMSCADRLADHHLGAQFSDQIQVDEGLTAVDVQIRALDGCQYRPGIEGAQPVPVAEDHMVGNLRQSLGCFLGAGRVVSGQVGALRNPSSVSRNGRPSCIRWSKGPWWRAVHPGMLLGESRLAIAPMSRDVGLRLRSPLVLPCSGPPAPAVAVPVGG